MRITPRHWKETAKACGLEESLASQVVEEVIGDTPRVIEAVANALPRHFPADLAEAIFAGMRGPGHGAGCAAPKPAAAPR